MGTLGNIYLGINEKTIRKNVKTREDTGNTANRHVYCNEFPRERDISTVTGMDKKVNDVPGRWLVFYRTYTQT